MSQPMWIYQLRGDLVRERVARMPPPTPAQVAALLRRGTRVMCVLSTSWHASYTPAMRRAAASGYVRVWGTDDECRMCWALLPAGRAALDTFEHTGAFG